MSELQSQSAKELNDWVQFIAAFANASGESLEDGKPDLMDAAKMFPAFLKLPAAISGSDKISLAALSPAEVVALCDEFKSKFDLPQDELESHVEAALDIAVSLAGPMMKLKDLVAKLKAKPAV